MFEMEADLFEPARLHECMPRSWCNRIHGIWLAAWLEMTMAKRSHFRPMLTLSRHATRYTFVEMAKILTSKRLGKPPAVKHTFDPTVSLFFFRVFEAYANTISTFAEWCTQAVFPPWHDQLKNFSVEIIKMFGIFVISSPENSAVQRQTIPDQL